MIVRVLGSGTSHGVPMIGCACAVCRSDDPRDVRTRPSILIDLDGFHLLVDTSTDLRAQALREGIDRVDAVFYTHAHADHVFGFDELRRFNHLTRLPLHAYGDAATLSAIKRTFAYAYDPDAPKGGGVPDVRLNPVSGPFTLGGQVIAPVPVMHGTTPVNGLRVGAFAYVTDCNLIPEPSMALLRGLDVLVIDALRHKPHPTHFTVAGALDVIAALQPTQAYLTHMAHDLPHAATCAALPAGVSLSYDGLVIDVPCR
ncbi:MAG: MBL fold metallo-hydrolase [Acidobacteriota bacterium]|nr:MBL fold metallo-hydrolase [Acidobacteriota bacterium]